MQGLTLVGGVGAGCKGVAFDTAVSYAVGEDGSCNSWGMGNEEDVWSSNKMKSK